MTVRVYGKVLEQWFAYNENGREVLTQEEIAYRDFDTETGELVGVGSEDFSPERERREIDRAWVWTWDGQRRNRGGYRWFENAGYFKFRKSERAALREYIKARHRVEVVDLRKAW